MDGSRKHLFLSEGKGTNAFLNFEQEVLHCLPCEEWSALPFVKQWHIWDSRGLQLLPGSRGEKCRARTVICINLLAVQFCPCECVDLEKLKNNSPSLNTQPCMWKNSSWNSVIKYCTSLSVHNSLRNLGTTFPNLCFNYLLDEICHSLGVTTMNEVCDSFQGQS